MKKLPKTKKHLRSTGDQLFVLCSIKKWGQSCVCGAPAAQVHHFFPKHRFGALRFMIENGVPICVKCHLGIHFSGDPRINESIIKNRGKQWYHSLEARSKQPFNSGQTVKWYLEQIKRLKDYLENKSEPPENGI